MSSAESLCETLERMDPRSARLLLVWSAGPHPTPTAPLEHHLGIAPGAARLQLHRLAEALRQRPPVRLSTEAEEGAAQELDGALQRGFEGGPATDPLAAELNALLKQHTTVEALMEQRAAARERSPRAARERFVRRLLIAVLAAVTLGLYFTRGPPTTRPANPPTLRNR